MYDVVEDMQVLVDEAMKSGFTKIRERIIFLKEHLSYEVKGMSKTTIKIEKDGIPATFVIKPGYVYFKSKVYTCNIDTSFQLDYILRQFPNRLPKQK